MSQLPRAKPSQRGVSHLIAFFVSLVVGVILVAEAPPGRATVGAAIYLGSISFLFGASALYHVPMWTPRARRWLRRLDHAAIFLLVAGSYTPIAMLALTPERGARMLLIIWVGAAAGLLQSLLWVHAPRPVSVAIYATLAFAFVVDGTAIFEGLGALGTVLIWLGGAVYLAGAVIYARRRPDPYPSVFGYHEIFHLLVIVAASLHLVAIGRVILSA
ncbi:MAG: hypothetical protein AMXMBFR64_14460 [Myxococcales bacterium]